MSFFEGYTVEAEEMSSDSVVISVSGKSERLPVSKIVLQRHVDNGNLSEL